jgi:hypothetical protein
VTALSRDGSTVLITAEPATTTSESGVLHNCAAFIYRHGTGGWALDGTLMPPGAQAGGTASSEPCQEFGSAGAISDDGTRVALLAGGDERVDIYERASTGWTLEQQITLPGGSGCRSPVLAQQIALSGSGSTLLAARPGCAGNGGGLVYVYTRSGSGWSEAQTIESPQPSSGQGFGAAVALSDDGLTAAISADGATGLPAQAGAAWVYVFQEGGWRLETRLAASAPEAGAYFSCPKIVGDGARVLCLAHEAIGHSRQQGSIYVFERPSGGWLSSGSPVRAFATEGLAFDALGRTGPNSGQGIAALSQGIAASEDGSVIDASIALANVASGAYGTPRMGYEFDAPPLLTTTGTAGESTSTTTSSATTSTTTSSATTTTTTTTTTSTTTTATTTEPTASTTSTTSTTRTSSTTTSTRTTTSRTTTHSRRSPKSSRSQSRRTERRPSPPAVSGARVRTAAVRAAREARRARRAGR